MQDAVKKILEGKFNKGARSLGFSEPTISLSLHEGEDYEGSFIITGPENEVTEGTVSSTRMRMKCLVKGFSGPREEIGYHFDSAGMEEGDVLKGEFRVISNQGEYFVPYDVGIVKGTPQSELGSIKNLFHFANLARTNWDGAVNLFYSEEFKAVFDGPDRQYYQVYRGLLGGERREQAVEEFLLEIKKKQEVQFVLEEPNVRIEDPEDMWEGKIPITRSGWGYCELFVEKEGDFLVLEKEVIREEDFLGNSYRLPFYVSAGKLHAGRNYGRIYLRNPYVALTVEVTVVNKKGAGGIPGLRRQKKHLLMELMQYYEAFRTKKIGFASWMKDMGGLVEKLVRLDEEDPASRLFQAQLLITQDRLSEAKWVLEQAVGMMGEEFDPALYSYYLYLTTLLNRQEEYTDEAAGQVERIFAQNSDNWRIAWLLLYLSGDYTRSPSRRWIALEDQFRQGCRSPVLYIEVWNMLAANPAMLMRLEDFELQVLNYAAKRELLTREVVGQVVYLSQRHKAYSSRLFSILKACYQIVSTDEVLQAICTLLIKGNITEKYAFPWYEKGIEKELRITRLYEYYMNSMELSQEREIPKIALMYFAFDSTLDSSRNAFLYAYVHRNRMQYPELYESYREQIERFVVFQILKGKNTPDLAYLYKNIFIPEMVTEETAKGLSTALFIHQIKTQRRDIRKVILIYGNEKRECDYPVSGQLAYIPIYGEDHRLLLEDVHGNRYCRETEYELEQLLVPGQLGNLIAPYVTDCVHFDFWMCKKGPELSGITEENLESMKRLSESDEVAEEVRREIRIRMLQFFFDNDRLREMDALLSQLSPEDIAGRCFARVVQFLVARGMYEKAYEWIGQRGCEDVGAKLVVRLCSRMLSLEGFAEEEAMTDLAAMAFKAGKYDENLLTYLCSYFKGTCREMRDIWRAAEAFGVDTYGLSERILLQMLYTGVFLGERTEIFKRYVTGGAKTEIELAFLAQCSYDYFVSGGMFGGFLLEDIQRATGRQEELPFVCKLAYTKFYAENKRLVDEQISRCLISFLREILLSGKCFPYFKEYADNIAFMRQFEDKTMVEYRVKDGGKAVIHYLMEQEGSDEENYVTEELADMFGGICVKEFILFFGEHLQYYITETQDGKEHLTYSGTLSRNDTGSGQRESKYSLLNDIAIGRNLHDYDTMEELLYEYFEKDFVVKELFHMQT